MADLSFQRVEMNAHVKMSRCGYLLAAGLFLIFIPAQAEEQAPVEKPSSASYSGSLRGTYDYRRLGSYDDHDAYGYWYLRGRNLADKRVDIYTSGRLHSDLDGTGKSYAADPFMVSLNNFSNIRHLGICQITNPGIYINFTLIADTLSRGFTYAIYIG